MKFKKIIISIVASYFLLSSCSDKTPTNNFLVVPTAHEFKSDSSGLIVEWKFKYDFPDSAQTSLRYYDSTMRNHGYRYLIRQYSDTSLKMIPKKVLGEYNLWAGREWISPDSQQVVLCQISEPPQVFFVNITIIRSPYWGKH
jgi:hypothetical protein